MARAFTSAKSGFFLGLVVWVLTFEMLFSWTALTHPAGWLSDFPLNLLLNYLLIPPSLWIFIKYRTDTQFHWKNWHWWLFLPALTELLLQVLSLNGLFSLQGNPYWTGFSEYLPLLGFLYVITWFWFTYLKVLKETPNPSMTVRSMPQLKLLALMISLTLLGVFWITFTFIGWRYFFMIEYLIIFLFFGLAFLNFLEGQTYPDLIRSKPEFSHYNDEQSLEKIRTSIVEEKAFLKASLTLKDFAANMQLPERYVSYLINHYHGKNFKEFINHYRVENFIAKARTNEKEVKTLLALALESGFSSKSTFNQVFKNHTGKTPSSFLK